MVINGINMNDVSVVVPGAVDKNITPLCLASVREHLPGAEIILSTWEGTNVEGLDYDQVVLNKDPGGFDYWNLEYSISGSLNRQIVSTLHGLNRSERKYAVKVRTDFVLESCDFLNWFDKFPDRNDEYSFFKSKIICCDAFSRDPRYRYRLEFLRLVLQPSDFFFFGYRKDLIELFDIPLMTKEEQIWFAKKLKYPEVNLPSFPPEEYLWVKFLAKHIKNPEILPADSSEITSELIRLTEATFAANLIILSFQQIGIQCGKSELRGKLDKYIFNCYTHNSWKALYRYYCQNRRAEYMLYRCRIAFSNLGDKVKAVLRKGTSKLKVRGMINRVVEHIHASITRFKGQLTEEEKQLLRPLGSKVKPDYGQGRKRRKKNYVKCYLCEEVTDENLSVMVQGPVRENTAECLNSVRRLLPKAELIFSTWEGSDVTGLTFDKVIFSKDPGGTGLVRRYPHEQVFNVNRIIVSSFAGIKQATRMYCLRLRSDLILTSLDFLGCYNKYSVYVGQDAIVSRRIMVDGLMTSKDLLFDVGDWWHLGLTSDMYRFYNIPLCPNEKEPYFERKENIAKKPPFGDLVSEKITEQYVIWSFIHKYGDPSTRYVKFLHTYDNRPECVALYRKFVAENLLCIEQDKTGIILPKYPNVSHPTQYYGTMPFGAWLELCHAYGTVPDDMNDADLTENYNNKRREYLSNPRFFGVEHYANTIKAYASLKNVVSIPDAGAQITEKDITFVVSGEIVSEGDNNTHHCLVSIRRFFPGSKIILSTWDNDGVDTLSGLYDQLVLLPDAHGAGSAFDAEQHVVNRLQSCVHMGMREVQTRYAVRMRTDQYLYNDHFLTFYLHWAARLSKRDSSCTVFQRRVLLSGQHTFEPRSTGRSYCISDSFQFGLTEDLLMLWDGHQESAGTLLYFSRRANSNLENPEGKLQQYESGQYLLLNVLRKTLSKLHYPKYYSDRDDDSYAFETEKVFASNFLVGNNIELGIAAGANDQNVWGNYSSERLFEIYLYNIEPDNEACLEYLKNLYTLPQATGKVKIRIVCHLMLRLLKSGCRKAGRGAKRLLRLILPAYRVSSGTRDRLMNFENAEADRFNYLVYRVNELENIQRRNEAEIKSLKERQRLLGMRNRRNDSL